MKKLMIILSFVFVSSAVAGEPYIPNYGYFHYNNEKSAKREIIPHVDNIFDFETSANVGGERIEKGKYYIDVKYQGKQDNGRSIDVDHIYLDDIVGKDGKDGRDGKDGEKGEKGDKGEKGERGKRGKKGEKGDKGDTGERGRTGEKGEQGEAGQDGKNGNDGVDGQNGEQGEKGDKGDKGDKGKDVDPETVNNLQNQLDKLQEPKYYLVPQVRVYDGKRLEVKPYAKFDVQDSCKFKEAGVKVTFKLGKSYEEKLIEEQNEQIRVLAEKVEASVSGTALPVEENVQYTVDEGGMIIGISNNF